MLLLLLFGVFLFSFSFSSIPVPFPIVAFCDASSFSCFSFSACDRGLAADQTPEENNTEGVDDDADDDEEDEDVAEDIDDVEAVGEDGVQPPRESFEAYKLGDEELRGGEEGVHIVREGTLREVAVVEVVAELGRGLLDEFEEAEMGRPCITPTSPPPPLRHGRANVQFILMRNFLPP